MLLAQIPCPLESSTLIAEKRDGTDMRKRR